VAVEPWASLEDVTAWLRGAIASGAIPCDAEGVARWRATRTPRRPAYICGPEAGAEIAPAPMDPTTIAGLP
jgi:hypothetical protein